MILPQRLRAIPSLEMCWFSAYDMSQVQVPWDDLTTENSELHRLCRMVPQAFPHVLHLNISLLGDIRPTGDNYTCLGLTPVESAMSRASAMERVILGPIESMLRALGPGREFSITVSMKAWGFLVYKHRALYGAKLRVELYITNEGRFWKALDPANELGYWISSGTDEDPRIGILRCVMT